MSNNKKEINVLLANLIEYAKTELELDKYDAIFAHNTLLKLFSLSKIGEPTSLPANIQEDLIDQIVDYAIKNQIISEDDKLMFETKVMGIVTPAPSNVIRKFDKLAADRKGGGIIAATQYLNDLGWKTNYLRKIDIDKNIVWEAKQPSGDIIISINLAKPEKDNKQVAAARKAPQTNYPKCVICLENLGLPGKRETLRVIPFFLNDEEWFFQFSPYVYFKDHCITVAEEHRPMHVDKYTFVRLIEFVEMFPHLFMGSNSDLPIVGGSILAHEHYQGGAKVLPMFDRKPRKFFFNKSRPGVTISILDWYNSVIKITSLNKQELIDQADELLNSWRNYSNESINILAKTNEQHNTVTAIASNDGQNGYSIYLILRNNRTDETHPYGIFHPTEDMHNIKKEGIGLIEAMGLFVLPGRLKSEIDMIADILTGTKALSFPEISKENHPLCKHLGIIMQLANDHGLALSREAAISSINTFINNICFAILECTAVFKNTDEGQQAFSRYIESMGFPEKK